MKERAFPAKLIERAARHITGLHETIVQMGGAVGKTGTLDDVHEALLAHKAEQPLIAEFKRDRIGHNGHGQWSDRMTYVAHARGYVMARHPGCKPFVISEAEWNAFPLWEGRVR